MLRGADYEVFWRTCDSSELQGFSAFAQQACPKEFRAGATILVNDDCREIEVIFDEQNAHHVLGPPGGKRVLDRNNRSLETGNDAMCPGYLTIQGLVPALTAVNFSVVRQLFKGFFRIRSTQLMSTKSK